MEGLVTIASMTQYSVGDAMSYLDVFPFTPIPLTLQNRLYSFLLSLYHCSVHKGDMSCLSLSLIRLWEIGELGVN